MQRRIWLMTLKEGKEDEYRRAHANVWPQLIQTAQGFGLKNQTVFICGRKVIAYIEAEDFEKAWRQLVATDVKRRWTALMDGVFEDPEGPPFEDIFHFD
jgi:L-rhamnose mutarotase